MILSNMLWMPKKDVGHLLGMKNRLTVYSKFDNDNRIETFVETDDYFGIPRNYVDVPDDVDDQTILPEKIDINFNGELRPIQQNIVNDWEKLYKSGINDWIIKGDTGVGKTIIMIKIACELKVPFLVIVPLERLMTYWIDQIKKFTDIKDVGIVQQNVCEYEGYAASVGMVHSLCKDKYTEEFKNHFGLIIIDECLHPSHDILTTDGWISIKDVTIEHKVAQYDAETGDVTFVNPERIICNQFEGNLVNIKNRYYDLLGTPNHEQPIFSKHSSKYDFKLRRKLLKDIIPNSGWYLPISAVGDGNDILSFEDRFRIMFQADGCIVNVANNKEMYVRFSFRKQRKIDRCEWILKKCGYDYKKTYNARQDCNITLHIPYSFNLSKDFSWVGYNRGCVYYNDFLDELYRWDGWQSKEGYFYENCNKDSAEFVRTICFLAGRLASSSTIKKIKPEYSTPYRTRWGVKKDKISITACKKTFIFYSGPVHCVTVPKGNIVVRRNAKVFITGNCHATAATQFSKVLPLFKAKHRIGASATLERQDGMEKVYYFHLGKHIISSEKKTQPKPSVFVYKYEKISGRLPVWIDRYDVIKVRAYLLSLIAKNEERNRLIADFAHTLMEKGLQTLIIGDRIAQLEEIQSYLIEMGYDDTGLYIGKTPDKKKKWIEKNASCILATLKMLEIGIDIDTLRGLVFATPKSEVKQVAGRIRRINPIVPEPIIVDIVDVAHNESVRWYGKRKKFYEEENFPIKHIGG